MANYRIMCCNIRTQTPNDGDQQFFNRVDYLCDTLNSLAPDVIGFQEVNHIMRQVLSMIMIAAKSPKKSTIFLRLRSGGKCRLFSFMTRKTTFSYLTTILSLPIWNWLMDKGYTGLPMCCLLFV